jgi:hypothetical protein
VNVETAIGFALGYWIGTRQGRQGMQKALDSARDIWASPETRKLLGEGLSALEAAAPALNLLGKRSGNGKAAVLTSFMDELIERRNGRRTARAA